MAEDINSCVLSDTPVSDPLLTPSVCLSVYPLPAGGWICSFSNWELFGAFCHWGIMSAY